MFKKILLCGFAALLLCLTGCVRGGLYAPIDEIKQEMSERHPAVNVLTPYWGDGFVNVGKISLRVLCFIPTVGLSEAVIGPDRRQVIMDVRNRNIQKAQKKREEEVTAQLQLLIGKGEGEVLAALGVPSRVFPLDNGGKVLVYEKEDRMLVDKSVRFIRPFYVTQWSLFFDRTGKLERWSFR